jgi:hypothetical protein
MKYGFALISFLNLVKRIHEWKAIDFCQTFSSYARGLTLGVLTCQVRPLIPRKTNGNNDEKTEKDFIQHTVLGRRKVALQSIFHVLAQALGLNRGRIGAKGESCAQLNSLGQNVTLIDHYL